jgi:hypothetical protein
MDKLYRNWIIVIAIVTFVGIGLFLSGLAPIFKNKESLALSDVFLCLVSGVVVVICAQHWVRILKGKIVFQKSQAVALNGGGITIPIPSGSFELWLFCRVPFAQYNGQICVADSNGNKHIIDVPRRNPFLYPIRSNLAPIIWRLPHDESSPLGQCYLAFHLLPSFAGTPYDRRIHKNNEESLSVLVKVSR